MSFATRLSDLATRVATECKSLRTLLNGNAADNSALITTAKSNLVAAINEVKTQANSLAASGGATINDASSNSTTQTYSINKILQSLTDLSTSIKSEILGGVGLDGDTLAELKAFIDSSAGDITALVANRLRFDAPQTLTTPQKVQVNENAGSLSLVQSGDPETNLVNIFQTGLA
jgi:hypothetical protein